jgi:hypothetical protein
MKNGKFCRSHDIVVTNPDTKKVWSVPYNTNPGFVLYCGSQMQTLKDLFWIVNHKSSQFSKIRLFSRIQQILSTIAQNESLKIQICKSKSLRFRLANPDSRVQTLRISIADLIRRPFFIRFVSWIWFIRPKISNYSICFDSEGLVYESRILNFSTFNLLR